MKPFKSYKDGYIKLNPELYMESIDLDLDKLVRGDDGQLTGYWYNDQQKEWLANVINAKINEYFRKNIDKILAESKEYVGTGLIVK